MRVAVVTVGDELLAGDTVNTNAAWLGEQLGRRGAHVERVVVVPDRVGEIAAEVNRLRATHDAVVVTGGLGPTHDDLTINGVAAALGVPVEESADAVAWYDGHAEYSHDDLVDGTADLPRGARLLMNPVGVAPGAVCTGEDGVPIYVLPGVPREMEAMFEAIADEFDGEPRTRRFVETTEPESALIDRFAALQEQFAGVTVGSYPGEDGVRVKLEGEDAEAVDAAADWLEARVEA
ncbi:MAG: molybdopterin-binding protein [Halobacteriales archaeon]|nr:molybdopterin-binding protein [Halobacteriales archaeon]